MGKKVIISLVLIIVGVLITGGVAYFQSKVKSGPTSKLKEETFKLQYPTSTLLIKIDKPENGGGIDHPPFPAYTWLSYGDNSEADSIRSFYEKELESLGWIKTTEELTTIIVTFNTKDVTIFTNDNHYLSLIFLSASDKTRVNPPSTRNYSTPYLLQYFDWNPNLKWDRKKH